MRDIWQGSIKAQEGCLKLKERLFSGKIANVRHHLRHCNQKLKGCVGELSTL